MNKTTEALNLAEEALESCDAGDYSTGHVIHPSFNNKTVDEALAAIREALAEPDIEEMTLTQIASRHEPVQRPQNCGTGYCSCIECPYEPVSIPDHIICPFCESDHVPDWLHDLKLDAKAIRAEALEEAAKVAESVVAKQSKHINDGKPFYANMYWEEIAAAIRGLK